MKYWQLIDDTNVAALDDAGECIASTSKNAFVVLQDLDLGGLEACFHRFERDLRAAICAALSKTPAEFAAWSGGAKYDFPAERCTPQSCVAFKREGGHKLVYMRPEPLVQTLIARRLIPATTPHGRARVTAPRGSEGLATLLQSYTLPEQRTILRRTFENRSKSLDDLVRFAQSSIVAMNDLRKALEKSKTPAVAWSRLCHATHDFCRNQKTAGSSTARGDGRHFAVAWFMAYLAREGIVLWPTSLADGTEHLLPRLLKPFWYTFFVAPDSIALASALAGPSQAKQSAYTFPVFRRLLLETNFFERPRSDASHLLHLKTRCGGRSAFGHGANLLFKDLLRHHGRTFEDAGAISRYFGGGRKTSTDHAIEAFDWVDHPDRRKCALYRRCLGKEPPAQFPLYVRQWAADLRTLLPLFRVRSTGHKIVSLNYFLVYLISAGPRSAPRTWLSIVRDKHINSNGNPNHWTFVDFLSTQQVREVRTVIADIKKAWTLAAIRDGFIGDAACPIDPALDLAARKTQPRAARTRRKSIDGVILDILIRENLRDDFAFARSLNRYDRLVVDTHTGEQVTKFWPALPIMFELLLKMGMRKSSASWLDSSEGDHEWIELESLQPRPNPLPSRTPSRRMGFLRPMQTGPSQNDQVLGSFIAVSKTGPIECPWVDPDTARLYVQMRDFASRFNPRRAPMPASRDALDLKYGDETQIPEVFPLFRDPSSRAGLPPSDGMISGYWTDLLRHCEPIVARELLKHRRQPEPLLIDGRPRWDIHSIRVTIVTTLLEAGVSPWIVAELVGHKSLVMTLYYHARNNSRTFREISLGMERRRQNAIKQLHQLTEADHASEANLDQAVSKIIGGMVRLRSDHQGLELFKQALDSREPGTFEVLAHGICPGGDCNKGGVAYKGQPRAVFRPRACSRCIFRITGPAFLNGLVLRLNALLLELKNSMDTEAALNEQIDAAEDAGEPSIFLQNLVSREREMRDEIWAEWAAELKTVLEAERLMEAVGPNDKLPVSTGLDLGLVRAKFQSVHQLALLQHVVREGDIIAGASLEVPSGTREKRDLMLLEIARRSDVGPFFYELEPQKRRRALDAFGEVLAGGTSDSAEVDNLLEGSGKLRDLPEVHSALRLLIEQMAPTRADQLVP
jgi:hypothetical protein